jgi:putative endopeptidase
VPCRSPFNSVASVESVSESFSLARAAVGLAENHYLRAHDSHDPEPRSRGALLTLAAAPLAAQRAIPGLDRPGMDTTIRPGNDFYRYANGNWERRTPIPPDLSSFGGFDIANEIALAHTAEIVHQAAAARAAAGSDVRKIGDYYRAFVDTAALEKRGMVPTRPLFDSIAAINDRVALARFLGAHLRADVDVMNNTSIHTDNPFGMWVTQDFSHPTQRRGAAAGRHHDAGLRISLEVDHPFRSNLITRFGRS